MEAGDAGGTTSVCDPGHHHSGALSGLDSGGSTTPVACRRRSSWPCATLDDLGPADGPAAPFANLVANSPCRLLDPATLDPDPPRIREAGTAAEGALVSTLVDAEGAEPSLPFATPARGVAIAALPASSAGTQSIALAALDRPGLKRLELTERPDGSLVLNVAFDEEGGIV